MSDKTILCVDDERHILNSLKRLLRRESYNVLTAPSGPEGLTVLQKRHVQLVISDQRMPGMTGVEFLQKVKELSSDTVRVVLSGYADVNVIVDSINKGEVSRFLTKPWNDEELKAAIRQCLAHYDIVRQNRSLNEQIRVQNQKLLGMNMSLEEMVHLRTRSLQLSQEVLEILPLAVIGISSEGMIVLTNLAAEKLIDSLRHVAPGTDVTEVLPKQLADAVMLRLGGNEPPRPLPLKWDGKQVVVQIRTLTRNGIIRGCILMLEGCDDQP